MVDEESPPSASKSPSPSWISVLSGELSRMVGKTSWSLSCLERMFCLMREGENRVFFGGGGARNSTTVDWMAVVISALDV